MGAHKGLELTSNGLFLSLLICNLTCYCNRTIFRTRFNFVYFVLLAGSTKFSSIWKPYMYTSVSDTTVAVRKFLAYESWQTLEYESFTRTKISAITVSKTRSGATSHSKHQNIHFDEWLTTCVTVVSFLVQTERVAGGWFCSRSQKRRWWQNVLALSVIISWPKKTSETAIWYTVVAQTICCWWTCGFAWWLWFPSKNHHWNRIVKAVLQEEPQGQVLLHFSFTNDRCRFNFGDQLFF